MQKLVEYIAREPVRFTALVVGLLQGAVLLGWINLTDASIDQIAAALLAGVNLVAVLVGADVARAKVTPVHKDG